MALSLTGKINISRFLWKILLPATCYLLPATCYLLPNPAHAAIQWGLSVVEGYYLPKLNEINYILRNQKVELGPRNAEAKPFPYPIIYQGVSPEMPEMRPKSPKLGLQLQADINPRYAIVFGGSMAALDSTKRDVRPFFVGFWIPASRETRFSLSLNQFWLGVKRYWVWKERSEDRHPPSGGQPESEGMGQDILNVMRMKTRFYAEIGILAITRTSLTTDVWLHVYAPDEGFDFYKVTETESNGYGYASYLGIGGEYYIKKWLSLGLDIDYTVGGVRDIKFVRYFTVDPLEKDIIRRGDDVLYTDFKKGRISPLFIDLEGLDLKGQVRVYF